MFVIIQLLCSFVDVILSYCFCLCLPSILPLPSVIRPFLFSAFQSNFSHCKTHYFTQMCRYDDRGKIVQISRKESEKSLPSSLGALNFLIPALSDSGPINTFQSNWQLLASNFESSNIRKTNGLSLSKWPCDSPFSLIYDISKSSLLWLSRLFLSLFLPCFPASSNSFPFPNFFHCCGSCQTLNKLIHSTLCRFLSTHPFRFRNSMIFVSVLLIQQNFD